LGKDDVDISPADKPITKKRDKKRKDKTKHKKEESIIDKPTAEATDD
jgi:hypothetical protein